MLGRSLNFSIMLLIRLANFVSLPTIGFQSISKFWTELLRSIEYLCTSSIYSDNFFSFEESNVIIKMCFVREVRFYMFPKFPIISYEIRIQVLIENSFCCS